MTRASAVIRAAWGYSSHAWIVWREWQGRDGAWVHEPLWAYTRAQAPTAARAKELAADAITAAARD